LGIPVVHRDSCIYHWERAEAGIQLEPVSIGLVETTGRNEIVGVIVDCGLDVQVTLIEAIRSEIEAVGGSETAWAQASGDFPFRNKKGKPTGWGTYFDCNLN
jgi:hypothetical protein